MKIQRFLISIVVAAGVLAAQPRQTPAAAALGAARHLEEAEGNYPAAIEAYKKIVARAGADHALAAQALLRMGQCYEKLADLEARKAYERILREFPGEKDAATTARARLARLSGIQADTGIVAQQVGPMLGDKFYGPISSDGRYVAFEEHGAISVQDLRTLEAHVVIGVFNSVKEKFDRGPSISPDGKQVACIRVLSEGGTDLYVVGADGSNPRLVAKSVGGVGDWSPNGKHLLAQVRGVDGPQTVLISVSDGSRQTIPGVLEMPRMSPDGRYVAFFKPGTPSIIYTQPIEGGTPVLLVENAIHWGPLVWTPDGKQLLFYRNLKGSAPPAQVMDLWSIPVANGAPAGPARMVKDSIRGALDVTAAGDIYYQVAITTRDVYVAGVDAQATRLTSQPKQLSSGEMAGGGAWSPDGQYLAYYNTLGFAIRSARTGEVRNLIPTYPLNKRWASPVSLEPLWSADSRSLILYSQDGNVGRLDIQTGEVMPLWDDNSLLPVYRDGATVGAYRQTLAVAPDGRTIYALERDAAKQQTRIMRVDLQTKAKSEIYRMDADLVRGFALSRDGSRLLMTRIREVSGAPPPGAASIVILPTAGGDATELPMPPGARATPSWSSDGRRLLFPGRNSSGEIEIYSMPVEGGSPQLMGRIGLSSLNFLNASPDGTQIVFTDETWNNHLWVLKNAINMPATAR